MSWIFFSLLSGFLWALVNTLDKIVVSKWNPHPAFLIGIFVSLELIVSLLIFLFLPFPAFSVVDIGIALVAGACYIVMAYCYFKAILHDEISRLAPLFQIASIFLVIFAAVFLGEILTLPQYFGMFALIGGAFLLSVRFPYHLRSARAFLYMLFGSLFYAVNLLLLKYVVFFC